MSNPGMDISLDYRLLFVMQNDYEKNGRDIWDNETLFDLNNSTYMSNRWAVDDVSNVLSGIRRLVKSGFVVRVSNGSRSKPGTFTLVTLADKYLKVDKSATDNSDWAPFAPDYDHSKTVEAEEKFNLAALEEKIRAEYRLGYRDGFKDGSEK